MIKIHDHHFALYGDHGPLDYGDDLALWCKGCGRLKSDIDDASKLDELENRVRELEGRVDYLWERQEG